MVWPNVGLVSKKTLLIIPSRSTWLMYQMFKSLSSTPLSFRSSMAMLVLKTILRYFTSEANSEPVWGVDKKVTPRTDLQIYLYSSLPREMDARSTCLSSSPPMLWVMKQTGLIPMPFAFSRARTLTARSCNGIALPAHKEREAGYPSVQKRRSGLPLASHFAQ